MALPPNIPTSFVPASSSAPKKFNSDYTGAFGFFAYGVFVLVMIMAIGVFSYKKILKAQLIAKDNELAEAQAKISPETVQTYVDLRNRLIAGKTLLQNHIALTGFLSVIGTDLPSSVRFGTLHLVAHSPQKVTLEADGSAANFNSLAVLSAKIGEAGHVKDAIFSRIGISTGKKDGAVSFSLSAVLDPSLVVFKDVAAATALPVTPVSASTTTP
ncbi:MAG: hypothetical protein JWN18_295 [Parcubacteria group bacterium]|nr:hypothetical protein [Parcubacteria group bacterium]